MAVSDVGRTVLAAAVLLAGWGGGANGQAATAPAQVSLSREEQAQFLLTARITSSQDIPKGVTNPVRLTLTNGTLTHTAAFSTVDETVSIMKFADGRTELDFVDSYKYSLAAYQLAVLLGLDDMMPVSVEREVSHHKGSLVWWVDDVKWDEGQRKKLKLEPPDQEAWNRQMYRMRVFTQLVADTDRNTGNVLITGDWKLWMIDFTRAFRRTTKLLAAADLTRCERRLLERLRALTKDEVSQRIRPFVGNREVDALMARRDAIVALVEKQIAERGEAQVLY